MGSQQIQNSLTFLYFLHPPHSLLTSSQFLKQLSLCPSPHLPKSLFGIESFLSFWICKEQRHSLQKLIPYFLSLQIVSRTFQHSKHWWLSMFFFQYNLQQMWLSMNLKFLISKGLHSLQQISVHLVHFQKQQEGLLQRLQGSFMLERSFVERIQRGWDLWQWVEERDLQLLSFSGRVQKQIEQTQRLQSLSKWKFSSCPPTFPQKSHVALVFSVLTISTRAWPNWHLVLEQVKGRHFTQYP